MKSFRYYVCGLNIGDENYTVKAVVAVQPNGDRYYDHKLSEIEKGKLLSIIPTIQKAGIENKLPSSLGKDKRLFSILQTDCSKVVDENGIESTANSTNKCKLSMDKCSCFSSIRDIYSENIKLITNVYLF